MVNILEIRKNQKRERRERLLNEIIEWALDIAECETQAEFRLPSRKSMLIGLLFKYQAIDAKSEYIKVTSIKFGEDFYASVNKTTNILSEHLNILKNQIEGKTGAENRDKHWRSLISCAIEVTKKSAKIKTKDIS